MYFIKPIKKLKCSHKKKYLINPREEKGDLLPPPPKKKEGKRNK
jgi:hypothetical protein